MTRPDVRIIGLLCWFEEQLSTLSAAVSSASRVIDHLVAVDGAYVMFPEARPRSSPEQQQHILSIAQSLDLGVTLHVPQGVWLGNEVEKRNVSMELGEIVARWDRDWFYVIDADEAIGQVPNDLRRQLDATDRDVAEVTLWERFDQDRPEEQFVAGSSITYQGLRKFFRAQPGLRTVSAHFCVCVPSGDRIRWLRGDPRLHELEPSLQLNMEVEHRHRYRNPYRARLAQEYYRMRDSVNGEPLPRPDLGVHELADEVAA